MEDVKVTVGCMVFVVFGLMVLAVSVLIGHFFGFSIGLATLLVLVATLVFWLACAYYKSAGGDAE